MAWDGRTAREKTMVKTTRKAANNANALQHDDIGVLTAVFVEAPLVLLFVRPPILKEFEPTLAAVA